MTRSKYKKIYGRELIDHLKSGYSVESFCAIINVTRQTLQKWANKHPEFRDAYDLALSYSAAFWEDKLIKIAEKGDFRAVKFALEKIHARQYGINKSIETAEVEYSVDTGVPQIDMDEEEEDDDI